MTYVVNTVYSCEDYSKTCGGDNVLHGRVNIARCGEIYVMWRLYEIYSETRDELSTNHVLPLVCNILTYNILVYGVYSQKVI